MKEKRTITQEEFDSILIDIINEEQPTSNILSIPGIYEILAEHFNNDVLLLWQSNKG